MAHDRGAEAGRAGARPELVHPLGGNIYFLAKIGATDGKSFQQMAGSMTGMSEEEYRNMMIAGGRSHRRQPVCRRRRRRVGTGEESLMARITASVYTSHVPAIGAALDLGKTGEPYWQPVFRATRPPNSG
jgi:gallate dioxygenase